MMEATRAQRLNWPMGYMLYKDGRAREYFYYTNTSYGCSSQILGYKEGTVEVNMNKGAFVFYPNSGTDRSYTCGGSQEPQK